MKTTLLALMAVCSMLSGHAQTDRINLGGVWNLSLDSADYNYLIQLPGTTDETRVGEKHEKGTPLHIGRNETWQLAREYVHVGPAWYQREVYIPTDWAGKQVFLSLERCMWQTRLWVNGKYVGEEHSLIAPHRYEVTDCLRTGKNIIRLCVDNSPYVHLGSWSHGYSEGIQTVWNGVIGELFLQAKDCISVENVQCYSSFKDRTLRVQGRLTNTMSSAEKGILTYQVSDSKGRVVLKKKERITCNPATTDFATLLQFNSSVLPWDEYTPNLYKLKLSYQFGDSKGQQVVQFGFRDLESVEGKLLLNGYTLFLRGEHDPGSFPLTGYPSMEKSEWLRIFMTGKEYGLNHWRFHSWCPPEAAFAAADEVGIYLQPELPLFSQNWENTLVGQDAARDEFLFSELQRLLDTYGNHPSFMFMCMGNELKGDTTVLKNWVAYGKEYDGRHLYASNANLEAMRLFLPLEGDEFQVAHAARVDGKRYERRMGGYFNSERPNTLNDYSHTLKSPYDQCPIISHELGQWNVYPDFSEITKYTGVLKPRNLEIFKSLLEQKGMGDMASVFLQASGKLAAILYKEEMERVLRTPGMDGFQLLDIRDYQAQGSALVGLLNAFWENKGFITPEEFRHSCNDVTLLLKMPKRIWTNDEYFQGEIVIPNYYKEPLNQVDVLWQVSCKDKVLFADTLNVSFIPQGEVISCGQIRVPLNRLEKAVKLQVELKAPSLSVSNKYDVWVYPSSLQENKGNVQFAEKATPELLAQIEQGATVMLVPQDMQDVHRLTFANPFWNTLMFDYQPKTMGLVCQSQHPMFKDFPTESYTNWQWWELTSSASVVSINGTPSSYRPIIQAIDHPVRNDKLGAIMETRIGNGKLLICTLDILSDLDKRPVARQLKYSILNYMNSSEFSPQEVQGLKERFFDNYRKEPLYKSISFANENPEYPVHNMLDGIENTYCQLPAETERITLELPKERYITGCRWPVAPDGIEDFKIYITNNLDEVGDYMIGGDGKAQDYEARTWDNGFTVQRGKKGKYVILEMTSTRKQARIFELELIYGD